MRKEKIKDVIAGVLSLFFILIVFMLYFMNLFSGNLYYQNFFRDKQITNYELNNDSLSKINKSCSLNLPKEPTILLRMDDVRAFSVPTRYLVDDVIKENMSITLGVIPKNLEKDISLQRYLIKIKDKTNIEIAQHGTDHNESDPQITEEKLLEGNKNIQEVLGIRPVTYIPPYNNISAESRRIIEDYFYAMSADQGILRMNGVPEIGYSISTYRYDKNEYVPTAEIISKCKEDLENKNLCVIVIHPQEYSYDINNARSLSPIKLKGFKELLRGLNNLNASYSNFNDLVFCESET